MNPKYPLLPLDPALLNSRFVYKDGAIYHKETFNAGASRGKRAGSLSSNGYRMVSFNKKAYLESRIIWVMHNGDTDLYVDHIDGNRTNNLLENLRLATPLGNSLNAKTRSDNTSGAKNVYWVKKNKCWSVALSVGGRLKHIGCFGQDLEFATLVAEECRRKYHGEYTSTR